MRVLGVLWCGTYLPSLGTLAREIGYHLTGRSLLVVLDLTRSLMRDEACSLGAGR